MSVRWVRMPASRRERFAALLAAGTVAAGVGAATFYVVRLFLAREPLGTTEAVEPRAEGAGEIAPDEGGA